MNLEGQGPVPKNYPRRSWIHRTCVLASAWLCALPSTPNSIPLTIPTLGILGAFISTSKSLSAYVLPHNIPVLRLYSQSVCSTTMYYLYVYYAPTCWKYASPLTKIMGRKYGAKTVGGSLCSHNRKVTLPHGVDSTHTTESPPHVIISLYRLLLLLSAGTYSLI